MVRFPRLNQTLPISNERGWPATSFMFYWQQFCDALERAIRDIEDVNVAQQQAIERIIAAQATADVATEAAGVAHEVASGAQASADGAQAQADTALSEVATAQAAANDAAGAATSANEAIAQIGSGEFEMAAIVVGGQRFINNAGTLQAEA